ncbi:MAG: hypothetical protein EBS29_10915, partial [Chloroflexia bacterium]|nr:hypothetical protein [Chloroflexia bacterium]
MTTIVLLSLLAGAAMAAESMPLNFPITTLRTKSTIVRITAARNQTDQSGNPEFITAMANDSSVLSQGGAHPSANQLKILRQNLAVIEVITDSGRNRVGAVIMNEKQILCEAPLVGRDVPEFTVTGAENTTLRVDCLGGDKLVLQGMGGCLSSWVPSFNDIRVQGAGRQEIIFYPTSGKLVPDRIRVEPDHFATAYNTGLVLEMPRMASEYA